MKSVLAPVLFLSFLLPQSATAQGAMLVPVPSEYRIGGFNFHPPGDNWMQARASDQSVRLVYALSAGEGMVDMQAELLAAAYPIPGEAAVEDPALFAELSRRQQIEERRERLVARGVVEVLTGRMDIRQYTIVTKVGEENLYENFTVALAPDKSEYLVAKLSTMDKDFKEKRYWSEFFGSLASLRFSPES